MLNNGEQILGSDSFTLLFVFCLYVVVRVKSVLEYEFRNHPEPGKLQRAMRISGRANNDEYIPILQS